MWHIVVVVSLVHYLLPVYTAAVSMHGGWYPITLGPGVMPLTMMGTVLACEIPWVIPERPPEWMNPPWLGVLFMSTPA